MSKSKLDKKAFLAHAEKNGYSKEEAKALIEFTEIIASKVVKKFVLDYIVWAGKRDGIELDTKSKEARVKAFKKVHAKVGRIVDKPFSGYQEFKFREKTGDDYILRYQLAIVPNDYEILLHIPEVSNLAEENEKHRKVLLYNLDRFIDIAKQFYGQMINQSLIVRDLAEFLPDADVSELQVNVNNRTLFLENDCPFRIGVMCFYVNEDGEPIDITEGRELEETEGEQVEN